MEKKIESIPTTPTAIDPVGSQVDEIDQRYRKMTLVINGLNTQYQTGEGVLGFGRKMLKVNLVPGDIDEVANLGLNRAQQTATKVTFTSLTARNRYYKARGQLKGTKTTVWVNEDLSKGREILARDVRHRLKGNRIYKAWTNMGLIYAKTSENATPAMITKHQDIEELIQCDCQHQGPQNEASTSYGATNTGTNYAAPL